MVRFSFMSFFLIQELVQLRLILTIAETGHEFPILLCLPLSPENPENTGMQCHTGLFCSSLGDGALLCSWGLSCTRRDLSLGQRAGNHYSWPISKFLVIFLSIVCFFIFIFCRNTLVFGSFDVFLMIEVLHVLIIRLTHGFDVSGY